MSEPRIVSVNFMQQGRWMQCAYCGVIREHDWVHHPEGHWCGAPWQSKASDIPEDWIPGCSPLTAIHYPSSPFLTDAALEARLAALTTLFGADQENWTDLGWVRNQLVEANKETLELRASLAAAQADAQRLDWLEEQYEWEAGRGPEGMLPGVSLYFKFSEDCADGGTFREALDLAKSWTDADAKAELDAARAAKAGGDT